MARKTSAEKKWEKDFDAAYKTYANGVQFNMSDLGNVEKHTKDGVASGKTIETAIQEAITKYRLN